MHRLAICRECFEPSMPWVIKRPPDKFAECAKCGGVALVSQEATIAGMAALIDEVFRGVPPARKKREILKIAAQVASGALPIDRALDEPARGSQRQNDLDASTSVRQAFVGGAVFIVLTQHPGAPSLDEQMRDLMSFVQRREEQANAWIPGPGKPVPVLGKNTKPAKKKDSQSRSRKRGPIGTSGAPKPSRREVAKGKKKKD